MNDERVREEIDQAFNARYFAELVGRKKRPPPLMPNDMTLERYRGLVGKQSTQARRDLDEEVQEGRLRVDWRYSEETRRAVKVFIPVGNKSPAG